MGAIALSITKQSFRWIPNNAEETVKHVRESEEEDELEGELAEFLEADVAENYEARAKQGEARCSAVHGCQNPPIARRQIPHHWLQRRHFPP